jgi:hypothetical protein
VVQGKRSDVHGPAWKPTWKPAWTRARAAAFLALLCAALLETLYGCAGEQGVEDFVDENVGQVAEALTCDYVNCTAPDPCHVVAPSCGGSDMCAYLPAPDGTSCGGSKVCSAGACVSGCFIGNQLFPSGTVNSTDPCQVCTPASATTAWTALPNGTSCGNGDVCGGGSCLPGCFIGGTVYTSGSANPTNSCEVCTSSSSTTAWSNVADGSTCATGMVCSGGSCVADCFIGGSLFTSGALNPNDACQVCTPSGSTSTWALLPNGTGCGTGKVCNGGSCVGECYIGGSFYGAGIGKTGSACQACEPVTSTTGWSNAPDGTSCGGGEVCASGSCVADCFIGGALYAAGTLNGADPCQVCTPSNTTVAWTSVADGTNCGSGAVCGGGACMPGCFISKALYPAAATNPNNVCQICMPSTSTSVWSNVPTGTLCDVGFVCAGGMCQSGCFIGGTLYPAGTTNPNSQCQACIPGSSTSAWSNKADGNGCNDNNSCTQTDTCRSGACVGGSPVTCAALDQCHVPGTCNAATGICSNPNKADGTACTSGSGPAQCSAGLCAGIDMCGGATPVVCTALDQCHDVGTCAPANGQCSNPAKPDETPCNDGNSNTVNDACKGGVCMGQNLCAGVTCTAMDQCHDVGTCTALTGFCTNPSKADGTACDDKNPCTTADTCQAGACNGGAPVVCAPLDQCHAAGTCVPASGMCSTPNQPDGTACDDKNANTVDDVCKAGLCAGVDNCGGVTCTAMDQCHVVGTCAPATGLCDNPPQTDGTPCNDDNPNTTNDVCMGGTCKGSEPCAGVACKAIDECHAAGTCDPSSGQCTNPNKADGTPCADAAGDVCTGGVCGPPDPCTGVACAAADSCHEPGTCQQATGACTNPVKADGAACEGGTCKDAVCIQRCAGVTCEAADACHVAGTCDPGTGKCTNPEKPNGTTCSSGTCESGVCTAPTNFYACAAAPEGGPPALAGVLGAALALAGARLRRRRRVQV